MEDEVVDSTIEQVAPEAPTPAQTTTSNMLDQERVNNIVKRVKMEAYDKAKREYAAELEALKAAQQQAPAEQQEVTNNDDSAARQRVREELMLMAKEHQAKIEREAEEQRLRQIADTYFQKMQQGPELFEDFEQVMKDFNPSKNADVIELAHDFDNLPQVMYELANNRLKAAELRRLAKDDPEDARYELQRLAKSISQNEEAQNQYVPAKPPLSKPKASNVGTKSGEMTLQDYKNASWNRF